MSGIDSFFSAVSNFFFPEAPPLPEEMPEGEKSATPLSREIPLADWTPSRPTLSPPSHLPLSDRRLLAVTDRSRELGDEILETLSYRLQGVKDQIQEISSDNMSKLREAALRAQDSSFWSILRKIATALISAVSVIFGISIVASGGGALIGGAMIASGILSLANFAFSELGTWDWVASQIAQENEEQKRKIAMILPAAVGILAGGIGLVGSVNAVASNAVNFAEKVMSVVQSLVSLFDGMTTLGKGAADARLLWTQADLRKIQGDLLVKREDFALTLDEIKGSLSDFNDIKKKAKKAIERIADSNIQLTEAV